MPGYVVLNESDVSVLSVPAVSKTSDSVNSEGCAYCGCENACGAKD